MKYINRFLGLVILPALPVVALTTWNEEMTLKQNLADTFDAWKQVYSWK